MSSLLQPLSRPVIFALAAGVSSAVAQSAVALYPPPQEVRYSGQTLTLSATARLLSDSTADADAVRLLRERLRRGVPAGGAITEVRLGKVGDASVKGFDADVPVQSGAYRIAVRAGTLVLVGRDDRGVFYAVRTLTQLLDADANPADFPAADIVDFPVIPFRGIVEGFYGTPDDGWSHGNRLSLIALCGRHKMDTYIYGPKDDPFHRSAWRKPYPAAEAERIRELVTASRSSKVDFVWAIHPGGDIRWTESDYLAAKQKFEDMYKLGVRSFAVFFDDIGGEGTKADKQAGLLNRLNREFVKAKGDVTPLILCPTQYNRAWSGGDYLDALGTTLDPDIRVMWTGDTVVADLDGDAMRFINGKLRRKAYIWWNAPCNDFCRTNLNLGPIHADADRSPAAWREMAKTLGQRIFGNTAEAAGMMSGFVSNPMGRSEASKVGLYGVAGYAWNPRGYDALAAWNASMADIMPNAPDAFRTFCEHNGDNGPNSHGYRRPESVAMKPCADAFLAALRAGRPDAGAGAALRTEFEKIAAAPSAIRAGADNPELLRQIGPWLDAFAHLGASGVAAVDAAAAKGRDARWPVLAKASAEFAAMEAVSAKANRNPWQPGVKVGSLVMTPFVAGVLKSVGDGLYSAAVGNPPLVLRGQSNYGAGESVSQMLDDDAQSYFYSEHDQREGDWFSVEAEAPVSVSRVSLVMGRKDGDRDVVKKGQLEFSTDGKTWAPLGAPTSGESVYWEGKPVKALAVRYRALETAKAWVAIREFRLNPAAGQPTILTSVKHLAGVPVRKEKDGVSLTPQLEVFTLDAGKDVGVTLPSSASVVSVEVDLSAAKPAAWAKLELSEDGKKWTEVKFAPKGDTGLVAELTKGKSPAPVARAVRVRNAGKPLDAKLALFKVRLADSGESVFTDGRLETLAPLGDGRSIEIPAGTPGVTLFFGVGSGKDSRIGVAGAKDVSPRWIATASGDIAEVVLPAGAKWLVVKPAAPEAMLHEAVWRAK